MKQAHSSHPHQKMRKDTEYETLRGVPGKQCTQQVLFPSLLSILRSWPAQHRPFMMVSAGFSERKGFRSVLPLCRPGSKGSKHLGRLRYCLSFGKITTSMLPQTELGLLFVPLLLFGETVIFPPFLALLPDHCLHGFQLAWQSPAGVIVERWTVSAFKAQKVV